MIDSRKNEKARLSMKKIFMLSTFSFLFLTSVLIAEIGFLTWVFISIIMTAVLYVLVYVLKSAHWHLVAESIGGGSFIFMPILAFLVEVGRGKILPDDMYIYSALLSTSPIFRGAVRYSC